MSALLILLVGFDVMTTAADFFVFPLAGLLGFAVVPYVVCCILEGRILRGCGGKFWFLVCLPS